MLSIKKYAAIDIGSNAVRLLIATITEPQEQAPIFKKTSLVRVPIRLGEDVFLKGKVSESNKKRMRDTMQAFALLMKSHKVLKYKACATSAMRDAKNGQELAQNIKAETGIDIEIIDGEHEAAMIATTDLRNLIQNDKNYLYVDVGGGSTELSFFTEGEKLASKSFKIGTVRLLNDRVEESLWNEMKLWIQNVTKGYTKISLIGSGGNINNIFKSSGKKIGKPLSYFYLSSYYQMLTSLTYEERIVKLNQNADRADVIIPATKIYLSTMKWSRARKVYVPKIGLADGIIKYMYNEEQQQTIF